MASWTLLSSCTTPHPSCEFCIPLSGILGALTFWWGLFAAAYSVQQYSDVRMLLLYLLSSRFVPICPVLIWAWAWAHVSFTHMSLSSWVVLTFLGVYLHLQHTVLAVLRCPVLVWAWAHGGLWVCDLFGVYLHPQHTVLAVRLTSEGLWPIVRPAHAGLGLGLVCRTLQHVQLKFHMNSELIFWGVYFQNFDAEQSKVYWEPSIQP